MEDGNWKKVVNHKNQKRKIKQKDIEEERNKWEKLKIDSPHIVLPNRAKRLQMKLNIDKLEQMLLSDDFIDYQKAGWRYIKVLKSTDKTLADSVPPDTTTSSGEHITYSILGLNNGWGDTILFGMTIENEENSSD